MDAVTLFKAVSYLEDRDILRAWEATPRQGVNRRMLTRVLLAAVLTALLLSACAAVYLLTLEKRLTPSRAPEQVAPASAVEEATLAEEGGYLSNHREGNSPAAMATAEWTDTWRECTKDEYNGYDSWYQGNAELEAANLLYNAYTPEMAEKLFAIRDQYGVRLHSEYWGLNGPESLYQAAGTGDFFLADEYGDITPHGIYEDGSFACDGTVALPAGDVEGWCMFRLERNRVDVMSNGVLYIPDPAVYNEWEYKGPGGERLSMALSTEPGSGYARRAFAFYDTADWTVVLRMDFITAAGREAVEATVKSFDFQAICTGGENVQAYFEKGPTVSERETLSPADFLSAPEVQAAAAFSQKYKQHLRETAGKEERWKDCAFNCSGYYGGFPAGDEALDALAQELRQQYELKSAAEGLCNIRGAYFPQEALSPAGNLDSDYQKPGKILDRQQIGEWLGREVADNWESFKGIYSNGCFQDGSVYYLKKGCFFTSLDVDPPSAEMPFWAYDTAWGGTVTIVRNDSGPSYLLFETEEAYVMAVAWGLETRFLEEWADGLDLSRLP